MNVKAYLAITGMVFFAVGLLHLVRLIEHSTVQFGATTVPFAVSWVGLPIAWGLSLWAFRLRARA